MLFGLGIGSRPLDMPYCIYTDKDIADEEGNPDHVVPLSLGGANGFRVFSDKQFNSTVGSNVDGAIANDPLVEFARRNADARGHSRRNPVPRWRKSSAQGYPLQFTWGLDAVEVWDPREKRMLNEELEDLEGTSVTSQLKIDYFSAIRFAAQVALGGGYFVYGDLLRDAIDCDELRRLISLDVTAARQDPSFEAMKARICHRFHPDALGGSAEALRDRLLCEYTGRSTFISVPYRGRSGLSRRRSRHVRGLDLLA
jgi:hypothetical protein